MQAIDKAIAIVGTQSSLARKLGISPQAVAQWRSGARRIPVEQAVAIEKATAGKVTARALRPDLAKVFAP